MINQTTLLDKYNSTLKFINHNFIDLVLSNDLNHRMPLFKWTEPPESFNNNTLERCSYKTYKSIKNSQDKYNSHSDSVVFAYDLDLVKNSFCELIEGLIEDTGYSDLGFSNHPICYKKYMNQNGFMGWHTNSDYPGDRWYFTYNTNDSSFMRYIDPKTEEMITINEPKGWSLNHFIVGDKNTPLWHSVYTGDYRFSFGIRRIPILNTLSPGSFRRMIV